MRWFSKTEKIRCPDGRIALVYKDVDDAVPLALRDKRARGDLSTEANGFGAGAAGGEYSSQVSEIMFAINARNQSQVLDYRNAYLAYTADPCGKSDLLERITNKIMDERAVLDRLTIQAHTLLELVRHGSADLPAIVELTSALKGQLGMPTPAAAAAAIEHARDDAKAMLGGGAS
jgi:hypothetical protein